MKQLEVAKWLKAITIVIAVMGLIFFGVIMPVLAGEIKAESPEVDFLYWPGLVYGWAIGLGCYYILFQFWKVAVEIGKDNSFSEENAKSFVKMCRMSFAIAIVWFVGFVVLCLFGWMSAGFMILMVTATILFLVVAVLTAALSHLIRKAYEMKRENDLTI